MISGKDELSHKAILKIAVPMALGYLTTPLVGIADTAIVGQLGEAALIGGIAVASIFIGLLFTTFNFLRFGTSALTAQAYGRNDKQELIGILMRASLIAAIVGIVLILLSRPILDFGLLVMQPSIEVSKEATNYYLIRVLSAPFSLLNFVFFAWLLGVGRPFLSFLSQLFLNIANIVISYTLAILYDMGLEGVAYGTLLAETLTVLLVIPFLIPSFWQQKLSLLPLLFDRQKLLSMMVLNRDIMIRSFCLFAAFAFFTRQSAHQSDEILAANEILLHFFMVAGYFLDGFAVAAEQFVGRAIGSGRKVLLDRAIKLTGWWNFFQASFLSLFFLVSGPFLIDFMTVNEEVRTLAETYMTWAALTPLIGVLAFQMDGIFLGATRSVAMRNSMIFSLIVMIFLYYIAYPLIANHGLWLALSAFLGVRGLTLYFILKKEKNQFVHSFPKA